MLISSSILNADYVNLERDIKQLEKAGADSIHIDIMDGCFVENVTWGPPTVAAIKKITALPVDIHLMVNRPEKFIDNYVDIGINSIMVHSESTIFLRNNLITIKEANIRTGIALKLETSVEQVIYCLELADVVLLLSCDEGFGGRDFHPIVLEKVAYLNKLRHQYGFKYDIELDGGINLETAKKSKEAGADVLVAGTFVMKNNKKESINSLKKI